MYECLVDTTGCPLQFAETGTSILKIPAYTGTFAAGAGPVQELVYAIPAGAGVRMGSYHVSILSVLKTGHSRPGLRI